MTFAISCITMFLACASGWHLGIICAEEFCKSEKNWGRIFQSVFVFDVMLALRLMLIAEGVI